MVSLEALGEVVGQDESVQMGAHLSVVIVVIAFDGGLFDGPVHALDLAVGPRIIGPAQTVFDAMTAAGTRETMTAESGGKAFAILRQIGNLNPVISEHSMDAIRDRLDQGFQKCSGRAHVRTLDQLDKGKL